MPSTARPTNAVIISLVPGTFVVLWSTGFIGAKFGLPYAEPFTFLAVRFAILTVLLVGVAFLFRAPWPKTRADVVRIAVAGLLVHGVYLSGVFGAIHYGVSAGVTALIVGAQPLLTAVAAGPFLGERVTRRQWLGFLMGFAGVGLVVGEKVTMASQSGAGIAFSVMGLIGITAGTLYQKRHGGAMDLRTGSAIQFAASGVLVVVLALLFETMDIQWTGDFVFALSWLVVVLSLGAITLLLVLIRRGEASRVASLFYLTPPVTAYMAFLIFDETLNAAALAGFALTLIGVYLVTRVKS